MKWPWVSRRRYDAAVADRDLAWKSRGEALQEMLEVIGLADWIESATMHEKWSDTYSVGVDIDIGRVAGDRVNLQRAYAASRAVYHAILDRVEKALIENNKEKGGLHGKADENSRSEFFEAESD